MIKKAFLSLLKRIVKLLGRLISFIRWLFVLGKSIFNGPVADSKKFLFIASISCLWYLRLVKFDALQD